MNILQDPHENYKSGWVKIYRSITKKGWYLKSEAVHLWVHLLMECTHKEMEYLWNGKTIILKPGQFITGRKRLANETGISQSKIRKYLKLFKTDQQIDQQISNTSSLISILNFEIYQNNNQQISQQATNKRPTSDQQATTKQELEELKELKNIYKDFSFFDFNFEKIWNDYLDMRKKIKKPATENAKQLILKKLNELSGGEKLTAIKIIEQSIINSWQGIFPLQETKKNNIEKTETPADRIKRIQEDYKIKMKYLQ